MKLKKWGDASMITLDIFVSLKYHKTVRIQEVTYEIIIRGSDN